MLKKYMSVMLFTIGIINLNAQNASIGLRYEPCFFVDGHNSNDIWAHKLDDGSGIFFNSFSLGVSYELTDYFSNSVRLGYLGSRTEGDHGYNGFEVSTYLSYDKKSIMLKPLIGLLIHLNNDDNTQGVIVKKKAIVLASIGFEVQVVDHIIIGALLQLPITNSEFNSVSTNIPHNTYAKFLLKLVLGYEINL